MFNFIQRLFRGPAPTVLNLKGAAEMANGIEKYGIYGCNIIGMLNLHTRSPRHNVILTNIGSL